MVEMKVLYEGDLHCAITHGPSGSQISTDAPKDNHGRGEAFSPTDLVGAALGSCMLTIMGIFAQRHNLDIRGASARVTKDMAAAPVRRIGKLTVTFQLPKSVPVDVRAALESAGKACPVHHCLHPDVEKVVEFVYE